MESRPFKIGQDKDRIGALPDELLLGILERLSLPEVVRAGAVSRRWRHLPHQLSRLWLDVHDIRGTTLLETMDTFTAAMCRLLSVCPPAECKCDCKTRRAVKTLGLRFYISTPHLSSISHAVEDTVTRGETRRLEFAVIPPSSELTAPRKADWRAELGEQFMTFSRDCPVAFRWLTGLLLTSLKFRDSDFLSLIGACEKLRHLSLRYCTLVGDSALQINMPSSVIKELEIILCKCKRIELVSVPKLMQLLCYSWRIKDPPLRFGYVPELQKVDLACHARTWDTPFALSACFSTITRNLSTLHLSFGCQTIWIQPEHPMQPTAIFNKLRNVVFWCIFPECDLNWTLFILEAAPALQNFKVNRTRHSCVETSKDNTKKANVVWEPSKDLKHQNLKLLVMTGFEEEDKVVSYIRLVMELAAGLKRIKLQSQTCEQCNAIDLDSLRRSEADEASKHRIKERLTHGSSSSMEIIIC